MSLYEQIRDLIVNFHEGKLTTQEFREKFVPLFLQSPHFDAFVETVAMSVEGTYAEYVAELIDETELKLRLIQLAPPFSVGHSAISINAASDGSVSNYASSTIVNLTVEQGELTTVCA